MTETFSPQTAAPETKPMSGGSMLLKVLFAPTAVFRAVKEKPSWIVPLVVIMVVFAISTYFIAPLGMKAQMEQIMKSDNYTPEQKEQMRQNMAMGEKIGPIIAMVTTPIFFGIVILIGAGMVFLMGNVIFSGNAKFVTLFTMVTLSFATWIISTIIKMPLMLARETIDVRTSLALLLPGDSMEGVAYSFLNTFTDVFVIWQIALLVIGVKVIYDFATSKAAITVLVPVGVWALITVGLSAIF